MNGSFSTISAAVHVLTSWTFCKYIYIYNLELLETGRASRVRLVDLHYTILNCQLHSDPNSLFHGLVVRIERFTAGQITILVSHCHIAHVHGLS